MKIVALSDTHGRHWELNIPKCDLFIFAGDAGLTTYQRVYDFKEWLDTIPAKYKIIVMGNHDEICEFEGKKVCKDFFDNAIYLENESVEIEGIKIWGSPFSKEFNGWSFMKYDHELKEIWDLIPEDTDIVITHTCPFGILDQVGWKNQGSQTLLNRIKEIQPKIFIGGHLHEHGGNKYTDYKTDYYNVSILDDNYKLKFEPTIINYEK
ncbi:MAG: metallophosphoesterase family protein [Candidatus Helarchaeota archaeon]